MLAVAEQAAAVVPGRLVAPLLLLLLPAVQLKVRLDRVPAEQILPVAYRTLVAFWILGRMQLQPA